MKDVLALLDAGKLARRADEERGPVLRISALGKCPRALSCLLRGDEPRLTTGARGLRIFERGSARGRDLARDLMAACKEAIPERTVSVSIAGTEIQGHIDLAIAGDPPTVIEFKCRNDYGWQRMAEEGIGEEYEAQCLGYILGLANALGLARPERIECWLVMENADDCRLRSKLLLWDQARYDYFAKRIAGVIEAHAKGELAPTHLEAKPNGSLPWQCNYCEIGPDRCGAWGAVKSKSAGPDKPPAWSLA